jgi:hypothetical protein
MTPHDCGRDPGPDCESSEPSDLEAIPIDISALCPTDLSPVPDMQMCALFVPESRVGPDLEIGYLEAPEPKAQAPPGFSIHLSLRSPPA